MTSNPGTLCFSLADKNQGIAIVQNDGYLQFANAIFEAQKQPVQSKEQGAKE